MFILTKEQGKKLESYPNLKGYIESYIKNDGYPEENGCLPHFIYFFKRMCLDNDIDVEQFFNWDEETAEDFYSWGHNSRWANTFSCCVDAKFKRYVDDALYLVSEYGDIDIYKED